MIIDAHQHLFTGSQIGHDPGFFTASEIWFVNQETGNWGLGPLNLARLATQR